MLLSGRSFCLPLTVVLLQQASLSFAAPNITSDIAQNATVNALVYSFPLTQFFNLAKLLNLVAGANRFYSNRALNTAAQQAVVRPNEDTVYSAMVWDLTVGDVAITYPRIPQEQYHLLTVYDPYGNILLNLGSGYTDVAGTYVLRKQPVGATLGLNTSNVPSAYKGYVNSPSMYGIALLRLLVNSTNLAAVHTYQDSTNTSVIAAASNTSRIGSAAANAPPLRNIVLQFYSNATNIQQPQNFTAQQQLRLTAAMTPYCLPPYQNQTANVETFLSSAGVTNSTYVTANGVDLTSATQAASNVMNSALAVPGLVRNLSNQWLALEESYLSPNFGANYAFRAAIAKTGYLILPPPQTIYPFWVNTSASSTANTGLGGSDLSLNTGEALIYDFVGGPPPLQTAGFWSLTMYDARGYLIDNTRNVYRLSDRDNLTYPDGSLVYPRSGANASQASTKPFQILVQAADATPPANWTSNWLPSPTGNGTGFSALLRFYGGESSVVNGQYRYPIVRKVRALSNASA